jgi:4-amino-4-deoxy-L-arabinose transferase-like glycosyltransferase
MSTRGNWRFSAWAASSARQFWSQRLFPGPARVTADHGKGFWTCLAILVSLSSFMLLPNRSFPLIDPDEGRRAEISREMLANDDWIASTLNRQPYYDKPPLFHWLLALSFCCFGTSEATARLVPALANMLTIFTTFALGRRLIGNRAAFLGALTLTVMAGFVLTGRLVGLDGTLALFVTAALLTAHAALQDGTLRRPWWIASALLCGLGILTKGPIAGLLLIPPVVIYAWLTEGVFRPRLMHWCLYGAAAAAVVAPWLGLVLVRDPQMLYEFLVEHNLKRFVEGIAHEECWWYYLPVLAVACLPWSPLFPFFLWHLKRTESEQRSQRFKSLGFLILWASWCVAFFTLSRGKLPLYVLPSLPALALLTGWYLEQLLGAVPASQKSRFVGAVLPRLVLVLIGACWCAASYVAWRKGFADGRAVWLVGFATVAVLAVSMIARKRWPAWSGWSLCVVLMWCLNMDVGHRLLPALARSRAPLFVSCDARLLAQSGQAAVACPGQMWASVTFMCRSDILDTDTATTDELLQFLERHTGAFVILNHEKFELLRQRAAAAFRFTMLQDAPTGVVVMSQAR